MPAAARGSTTLHAHLRARARRRAPASRRAAARTLKRPLRRVGIRRVKLPSRRTATRTVRISLPSRWIRSSTCWRTAATGVIVPRSRYERRCSTIASSPARKTFVATERDLRRRRRDRRRRRRRAAARHGILRGGGGRHEQRERDGERERALHAGHRRRPARRANGSTTAATSAPAAAIAGSVAAPQSCDTPERERVVERVQDDARQQRVGPDVEQAEEEAEDHERNDELDVGAAQVDGAEDDAGQSGGREHARARAAAR